MSLESSIKEQESLRKEIEKGVYDRFSDMNLERRRTNKFANSKPKYKNPLQYTVKEFLDFKNRLGVLISEDGLSCDDTLKNSYYANYITNFVEANYIRKHRENILDGFTYKLHLLTLGRYNHIVGCRVETKFPVVQKFKGHFLVSTIYFAHGGTPNEIIAKEVKVKQSAIILT